MSGRPTFSAPAETPGSPEQQHRAAWEDIERRFASKKAMYERGGESCFFQTIAFTHPDIAQYYSYGHLPNLMLYAVAGEVAGLSGEEFDRDYFGYYEQGDPSNCPFVKADLERFLEGANAVWFGTIDIQSSPTAQEGFNHIIGIVPYRSPWQPQPSYMVADTSGYIDFKPQDIDTLFTKIDSLPHGKRYVQSFFAFRDRVGEAEETTDDLFFFTIPPSSPQ